MKKIIVGILFVLATSSFALEALKDIKIKESIACKETYIVKKGKDIEIVKCTYTSTRSIKSDRIIRFDWTYKPLKVNLSLKNDTRTSVKEMPIHHETVYDYRFLEGRKNGEWTIKVHDSLKNIEVKTGFSIIN